MALYGGLAKENHLSEFNEPLFTGSGVTTPAARKALARTNIEITATVAQLAAIAGVTPGTVAASKTVVVDANKDIAGFRNITQDSGGLITRPGRKIIVPAMNAKVGATAGWVVTGGTNISHATLPASQTNSTLVIPISGLSVGDQVTAVSVVGQIESAGGTVTATLSVRKLSAAAAADLTDAEIGTDNLGAGVTADTLVTDTGGELKVSALTETLDNTEQLYALITATTAAATDIDISALVITVTQS